SPVVSGDLLCGVGSVRRGDRTPVSMFPATDKIRADAGHRNGRSTDTAGGEHVGLVVHRRPTRQTGPAGAPTETLRWRRRTDRAFGSVALEYNATEQCAGLRSRGGLEPVLFWERCPRGAHHLRISRLGGRWRAHRSPPPARP